jgi:1-acyl-sn-glycerol-3-phosphate acyltransferase
MSSQFGLLKERRFLPFFATQFFGAFNDNLYKNALVILIAFEGSKMTTLNPELLVNLCAGLFILPFFLFSASAGQLADKFEKSSLIRAIKLLEIAIMTVAAVGFYLMSLNLLIGALFMMGVHSTLFGPVKYAILPQALKEHELVGGNAVVESGTFIAILLGTIAGGVLVALPSGGAFWVSCVVLLTACVGYLVARAIPDSPAAAPNLQFNWNVFTETWSILRLTRQNRTVFHAILGISWFWFYGALFLSQFPGYAKNVTGGGEIVVTTLLAVFSVGIGVGSMLCERLSGRMVEIGLVPFGSIGLSLFAIDLWHVSANMHPTQALGLMHFIGNAAHIHILFDLFFIGIFGGFFIVPLYAVMQSRSEEHVRSRIIAGNNIMNSAFMVVAAGMAIGLLAAGLTIPDLFLITGIMNIAVAFYIYGLVPEFMLRFLCWIVVHTIYRLKKQGVQNIPESGPALLVCNHVSFADALIISASCPRPIRFVMDHQIFNTPVLNKIFRDIRVIPIASAKHDSAILEAAFKSIAAELDAGELVCIFPEGGLTKTGDLQTFRDGAVRIVAANPVPVVPMALHGMWHSVFSRQYKSLWATLLHIRPFKRVGLAVGPAIDPALVSADRLLQEVSRLRGDRI